jgi:hypothetical protein
MPVQACAKTVGQKNSHCHAQLISTTKCTSVLGWRNLRNVQLKNEKYHNTWKLELIYSLLFQVMNFSLTGTVKDIAPTPTPVINLPTKKRDKSLAAATMVQPATKGKEHIIMLNFRPNLSMV